MPAVFDVDGVLIAARPTDNDFHDTFLIRHGFDYSPAEQFLRFSGLCPEDVLELLAEDFLARTRSRLPDGFFAEAVAAYQASANLRRAAIADMVDLVHRRFQAGRLTALASNSVTGSLAAKVDFAGLRLRFNGHAYSRDAVGAPKPAPDLHLHVARAFSVRPEECVGIEDSIPGIAGGKAAGYHMLAYAGEYADLPEFSLIRERLLEAGADDVVTTAEELENHPLVRQFG